MNFLKYQSIKRATDVQTLDYYIQKGWDKLNWYATEKIHGTNFSFISNGTEVKYAQRSCITEGIFNSQADVHKVESKINELAKHMGVEIQVFGEYFGGDIAGKSSIPYFADNRKEFIFFDIYNHTNKEFVSYPQNFELLDLFDIPRVPVLKTGTLQECLELDKSFDSLVAETKTHAEGFVIKPFNHIEIMENQRVLVKMISPEFDDVKKSPVDLKIAQNKQQNFEVYNRTSQLISECLNDIRVDKVAAKNGIEKAHKKSFGKLLKEVALDIDSETTETVDLKQIEKSCVPFIKKYFE